MPAPEVAKIGTFLCPHKTVCKYTNWNARLIQRYYTSLISSNQNMEKSYLPINVQFKLPI